MASLSNAPETSPGTVQEAVHNVTKEEIPRYIEMVTAKFQSRSIPVSSFMITWKHAALLAGWI